MSKLVPTIGIEVHAELKTKSKVFSPSLNAYGEIANSKTNVIDLGYPGTLPNLNREVIDLAIKACIVTHCDIAPVMYFDRKNYFYPDLSKGYQITQQTTPIGFNGYIEIVVNGLKKKIGIERLHIEEDTSKSIHEGESTLLDFNRAGIPLIEIVTKPVIESGEEAVLYLEKLRELLLYAEVSDVKIEEGSMRCDANVSLKELDSDVLGVKNEVKNIGSISSVKSAINYEIERQKNLLEDGEQIKEQTRRYDEKKSATVLMRMKESNNDYRYFPEPDIPYVHIDEEWVEGIKDNMPMLPDELREKYQALGINDIAVKALIARKDVASFLKNVIKLEGNPIISANLLTGDVLSYLNKHNLTIDKTKLDEQNFNDLVNLLDRGEISSKIGKELLNELIVYGGTVSEIIDKKGLKQISDIDSIRKLVRQVINDNMNVVEDYKDGNERSIKYLIGQVMKESKGQANPKMLNEILTEELSKDS
ncbi:MAG: Asp-tRNA(Asn)/Glu-tRNA(Gln) amidotransferase subunit GatB [Bacilli bacterium]|nr:Asp-tRNA(Asn)/Glu-tRNA(Gln) amidotransferase subunit GatB [Bacilli bacterium]MDD4053365.1 Asp-tRNA(Asn)/Glu-tRNA(Gln) amidotransferase subunit GatB [Bacilli bacterium]MDD4410988.1 Asp-tRNA(Asn)/Glu-tRNA(Gln) amidotransferase subunit GatB [Bacilli bacterium]